MQDIDAAYLFQDMGDIDDDLSSLLVPDLDFTAIANAPAAPAMPKLPASMQIGARCKIPSAQRVCTLHGLAWVCMLTDC